MTELKQDRRIRPTMAVSVAPALLSAIDALTRVTGEPRSHLVKETLGNAIGYWRKRVGIEPREHGRTQHIDSAPPRMIRS